MSKATPKSGGSAGAVVAGAVAAAVLAVGAYLIWQRQQPVPQDAPLAVAAPLPAAGAPQAQAPEVVPQDQAPADASANELAATTAQGGESPTSTTADTPTGVAPETGVAQADTAGAAHEVADAVPEATDAEPDTAIAEPESEAAAPETAIADPEPPAAAPVETAAAAPAEQPVAADALPDPSDATAPGPRFDELRREPDGMAVVAGRALPGAIVKLLNDGIEIARTLVDGSGSFALIVQLDPDGQGHVLTMAQEADGKETRSEDSILLAPLDAPEDTADAALAVVADNSGAETLPEADIPPKQQDETDAPAPTVALADPAVPQDADEAIALTEAAETTVDQPVTATPKPAAGVEIVTEAPENPAVRVAETETPPAPVAPITAPTAPRAADAAAQPPQIAVLKSTPDGVELLNPPLPRAMKNVALDTISYSDTGDVQLAGRARQSAEHVRVYLDNSAIAALPVDELGRWRGDLPDVDAGIYTLRVDEVSADGAVTSRVETPFKRESAEVLAAAAANQTGPLKAITVQKGATLWAIARDRYGDGLLYVRVFQANAGSIRDPDLIYPGQVFDLPD